MKLTTLIYKTAFSEHDMQAKHMHHTLLPDLNFFDDCVLMLAKPVVSPAGRAAATFRRDLEIVDGFVVPGGSFGSKGVVRDEG
jgi:hypothetical protein